MLKIKVNDTGKYYACDLTAEDTCAGEMLSALDTIIEYFKKEHDLGTFAVFDMYLEFLEETKKRGKEYGRTNN
jgi:hypothetical protein